MAENPWMGFTETDSSANIVVASAKCLFPYGTVAAFSEWHSIAALRAKYFQQIFQHWYICNFPFCGAGIRRQQRCCTQPGVGLPLVHPNTLYTSHRERESSTERVVVVVDSQNFDLDLVAYKFLSKSGAAAEARCSAHINKRFAGFLARRCIHCRTRTIGCASYSFLFFILFCLFESNPFFFLLFHSSCKHIERWLLLWSVANAMGHGIAITLNPMKNTLFSLWIFPLDTRATHTKYFSFSFRLFISIHFAADSVLILCSVVLNLAY